MRIGITCYPTYGGSGVVATELGIELAALGHEVHFISYSQPFRLSGRDNGIFYHEVPVSSYPLFEFPPYDLALASRMAEVAEFNELDLLHVHYAIPHSVSALLARQMLAARGRRLPFVTTLHGTDITLVGLDRGYLPITRYAIQESDGVTSISNYLKDETLEDFGVTRPIEVIPNFVNCDVYTPIKDEAARAEARLRLATPDEAILMHLSNFRPVKRVVDVVKVFAQVARELPAQLVLVGDGPDRSAAEWLAHDLGIQCRVHFHGQAGAGERAAAAGRSDGDAQRAGVVWAGGAGGHGLQGSVDCHAGGRRAGADRRWRDGAAVPGGRCGRHGRRSGEPAEGPRPPGCDARGRAQDGAEALLLVAGGAALRALLRAGAGKTRLNWLASMVRVEVKKFA